MPQTLKKGMGAILSEPDYRDDIARSALIASTLANISAEAASLPANFKTALGKLETMVLDQNQIPACVSHAWALCMMYWWYKKTGQIVEFSARFLDILSSETWIPIDGGRVPRTVCKVSASVGCCTTALLPNNTDSLSIEQYRNPAVITPAMRAEAAKYKIPGYVRIADDTILDFRLAVKLFGLVSGLFQISDRWWIPSWLTKDIDPLETAPTTSGHEVVVYGWDGTINWFRNCWSKLWNREGDGTYDAKLWLPYVVEGWAIADITADLKSLLSNLPKPADFHYHWDKDLQRGQSNDDIKFAQIGLMILGLLKNVAPEELGNYGPKTAVAVYQYQAILKIPPAERNQDRIGPRTRAGLNAQFSL